MVYLCVLAMALGRQKDKKESLTSSEVLAQLHLVARLGPASEDRCVNPFLWLATKVPVLHSDDKTVLVSFKKSFEIRSRC